MMVYGIEKQTSPVIPPCVCSITLQSFTGFSQEVRKLSRNEEANESLVYGLEGFSSRDYMFRFYVCKVKFMA